ncbi:MAG TPA: hypothetical protein VMS71_07725 [Candidatus Acidoferrum sp.]|nr:hypothetical protein [Candidatus Acidoferrum sp.]
MKIGPVDRNNLVPPSDRQAEPTKEKVGQETPTADRIEVSDDARRRLAELADRARRELLTGPQEAETRSQVEELATDRIARLKQKVASGFYQRPEVIQQVAEGLAEDIKP